MDKAVVLDTSAIISFFQEEPGANRVEFLLKSAQKKECLLFISFITLAELYYIIWREEGESTAKELIAQIKSLPVQVIESSERLTLLAGRIKANHRLSLADAFIAATALNLSGILVHKDPEFEQIKGFVSTEPLPFKRTAKY